MQLAEDMGMTVEVRQIPEDEIGTFDEAGACGTAAVISPIARIDDLDENKSYIFSKDGNPVLFAKSYTISYALYNTATNPILTNGLLS